MGNILHVIFHYFIDTQAREVRVEHLLLHKGEANNAPVYLSGPSPCSSCRFHEAFVRRLM